MPNPEDGKIVAAPYVDGGTQPITDLAHNVSGDLLRSGVGNDARTDLNPSIAEFIEKYKVRVLGDSQVILTLGQGQSRLELLQDAQSLARDVYGAVAVNERFLGWYASNDRFTSKLSEDRTIALDFHVEGSLHKSKADGPPLAELDDLIVAHAAYLTATNRDPIGEADDGRRYLVQSSDRGQLGFWPTFGSSVNSASHYDGKNYAGVVRSENLVAVPQVTA